MDKQLIDKTIFSKKLNYITIIYYIRYIGENYGYKYKNR